MLNGRVHSSLPRTVWKSERERSGPDRSDRDRFGWGSSLKPSCLFSLLVRYDQTGFIISGPSVQKAYRRGALRAPVWNFTLHFTSGAACAVLAMGERERGSKARERRRYALGQCFYGHHTKHWMSLSAPVIARPISRLCGIDVRLCSSDVWSRHSSLQCTFIAQCTQILCIHSVRPLA